MSTKNLVINATDHKRAARWLNRHGLDADSTSHLLVTRLAIRNRNHGMELIYLCLCALPLIAWSIIASIADISLHVGTDNTNVRGTIDIAAFYILLAAVAWWTTSQFLKTEHELAQELPRRAARSDQRMPAQVLGKWYVAAMVVMYPGGVALGIALAAVSDDVMTRILGIIVTVGTLAIGAINAFVSYKMIHRPAIADSGTNLAVDEGLRTEEAHRVPPYAPALALIVAVSAPSTAATVCLLTYGIIAAGLWHLGVARGQYRKLALPTTDAAQ